MKNCGQYREPQLCGNRKNLTSSTPLQSARLGDLAKKLIVVEAPYETSSPTVDSQVVQIKGANADIFVNIATPKFAAQAIKKIAELNWHPVQFLTNVSGSKGGTAIVRAIFTTKEGELMYAVERDGALDFIPESRLLTPTTSSELAA
jgi:hypothetical protein